MAGTSLTVYIAVVAGAAVGFVDHNLGCGEAGAVAAGDDQVGVVMRFQRIGEALGNVAGAQGLAALPHLDHDPCPAGRGAQAIRSPCPAFQFSESHGGITPPAGRPPGRRGRGQATLRPPQPGEPGDSDRRREFLPGLSAQSSAAFPAGAASAWESWASSSRPPPCQQERPVQTRTRRWAGA